MRKAIVIDPSNTRRYVTGAVLGGLTRDEVKTMIPRDPTALMLYGRYREELGDTDDAVQSYRDALSVMEISAVARPEAYRRIATLYERRGLDEQAAECYKEGVGERPYNRELRIGLARAYEKLKLPGRALEQYEYLLTLNPEDALAQKKVKELGRK